MKIFKQWLLQGYVMARPVYYSFSRYQIEIADEPLDTSGQLGLLSDNQGSNFSVGTKGDDIIQKVLCTDPLEFKTKGRRIISAEIGFIPGFRVVQKYNSITKKKEETFERDVHTKFGHVIMVPSLNAIAFRNRKTDSMLPAITTRSLFRKFVDRATEGSGHLDIISTGDDADRAFEQWEVTKFSWTVRPVNPSGARLAKRRSEAMNKDNAMRESGISVPWEGKSLSLSEGGTLEQVNALAEEGYGQRGVEGITEEGHAAKISKPKFHMDKRKNLKAREDGQLHVAFDPDLNTEMGKAVASALISFYGDDGTKTET